MPLAGRCGELIKVLRSNEDLWNLFTKVEEYKPEILDHYGRFSYYLSKHRDVFDPSVSGFLVKNGLEPEYPDGKKFAICLTHDIDMIYYTGRLAAKTLAKSFEKRKMSRVFKVLFSRLSKKINPLWNFDKIMQLDSEYGARSSFYFLTLDTKEMDFNFQIKDLKGELRNILSNGCEVGLHGGVEDNTDVTKMKQEKRALEEIVNQEIMGNRNHYLRFEVPKTWQSLKAAGFKYDTTFGYADCVGFRNGMCHPFKPFDLNTNQFIDLLEIPLVITDFTLGNYMHLDLQAAFKIIKLLIDKVEKYRGAVAILWHNTEMFDEMLELYQEILRYCHAKNAWMPTCAGLYQWWEKKRFLETI